MLKRKKYLSDNEVQAIIANGQAKGETIADSGWATPWSLVNTEDGLAMSRYSVSAENVSDRPGGTAQLYFWRPDPLRQEVAVSVFREDLEEVASIDQRNRTVMGVNYQDYVLVVGVTLRDEN